VPSWPLRESLTLPLTRLRSLISPHLIGKLTSLHLGEKGILEKERLVFGREVDGYKR